MNQPQPSLIASDGSQLFERGSVALTPQPLDVLIAHLKRKLNVRDYTVELDRSQCTRLEAVGGYSEIYSASIEDSKVVAVKCIPSNAVKLNGGTLERAIREIEIWSTLRHQNILELYGLGIFQGCLAMVAPWMDQGNVTDYVNKNPGENRYNLSMQVIGAVVYLHSVGVVHGDIKGANVLISHEGRAMLADFGSALLTTMQESIDVAMSGGTIRWMAPELFGYSGPSREADVYALGMTVLEIVTGKQPFDDIKSTWGVVGAVQLEKRFPRRPEQLLPQSPGSDFFWDALKQSWTYEPVRRASAGQLEKCLAGLSNDEVFGSSR